MHACVRMYPSVRVGVGVWMHACVCTKCVHLYYTCAHMCVYYTHVYMCVFMHACGHVCVCMNMNMLRK